MAVVVGTARGRCVEVAPAAAAAVPFGTNDGGRRAGGVCAATACVSPALPPRCACGGGCAGVAAPLARALPPAAVKRRRRSHGVA